MKKLQLNLSRLLTAVAIIVTLIFPISLKAQSRGTITGKVIARNEPADNVSIGLMGTSYGATTNNRGEFSFTAPAGAYTIIISYVGVERIEIPVTITAGQTTTVPTITINASLSQLTEVNVIANRANRFTRKVSVDAAKIPLTALENSQSYTTVTSELLKEQQVLSVDEALRNAPGIQKLWDATGRGGDGGAYFTLRGFTVQSRLRNGVAGLVTSGIDAVNVDKIEVIKGPSATLFGSTLTSFGGLINRVTKKPYETFNTEIGQSVGSYGLSRTTVDLNAPLTDSKNVLFRLNAAYAYEGSFQNYGLHKQLTIAPILSIKASDRLSFLLEAELFNGRNSAPPFFFFYSSPNDMGVHNAKDLNLDYRNAYSNDDVNQKSRSSNYFAQATYKLSKNFTSQTLFTHSRSFSDGPNPYYYLVTDAVANTFGAPDIAGDNNYILRYDQSTSNSKLQATEIQENINGDFMIGKMRNRFVVGLDYQRQNSRQIYFGNFYGYAPFNDPTFDYGSFNRAAVDKAYAATGPLTPANTFPYIYVTKTYSAYVSDVINLTDQLIASAGVRVDRYVNDGSYDVSGKQTAPSFNQTAVSPKFGLIYQPIKDNLSFFGNFQNGFVNPGPYLNAANENVIAKVQNAKQIEGGIKMALFNGKLNGTLSYYRINLTNTLRAVPSSPVFAQIQDGTQTSKGFEAEVIANPGAGFNIIGGFSYNDTRYTNGDAEILGRRPTTSGSPYLANFYVSYRLPESSVRGLGVGFGGNYASENKVVNSPTQGEFALPSYTLLNANIFFERAKYRFGVAGNNLTDKQYFTGYTTVNPQRLRQFILSASYKF